MKTELDHIVIACTTLDEGRAWAQETFGVEPTGGGKHDGLATHNTLVPLGNTQYLEIIAIDPGAGAATFPRWFGLDTDEVKAMIAHEPRLVAWVARVVASDAGESIPLGIETFAATKNFPASVVCPAQRADFRWRFAFTPTGARPAGGVMPHLIQWDSPVHPRERMQPAHMSLTSLLLGAPEPKTTQAMLEAIAFADVRVHIGQSTTAHLVATLSTPRGRVVLD